MCHKTDQTKPNQTNTNHFQIISIRYLMLMILFIKNSYLIRTISKQLYGFKWKKRTKTKKKRIARQI